MLIALLDDLDRRGSVRGSWFEKLVESCLDHPELAGLVRQYRLESPDGGHIATFDLALAVRNMVLDPAGVARRRMIAHTTSL